jgi:hypothetical protein
MKAKSLWRGLTFKKKRNKLLSQNLCGKDLLVDHHWQMILLVGWLTLLYSTTHHSAQSKTFVHDAVNAQKT